MCLPEGFRKEQRKKAKENKALAKARRADKERRRRRKAPVRDISFRVEKRPKIREVDQRRQIDG